MLRKWFGKKQAETINLDTVVQEMSDKFWKVEFHPQKENTVIVHGKYRNHQKDFCRLFVQFLGGEKIAFKDERGNAITHIPFVAEKKDLYHHMKNILNVL